MSRRTQLVIRRIEPRMPEQHIGGNDLLLEQHLRAEKIGQYHLKQLRTLGESLADHLPVGLGQHEGNRVENPRARCLGIGVVGIERHTIPGDLRSACSQRRSSS